MMAIISVNKKICVGALGAAAILLSVALSGCGSSSSDTSSQPSSTASPQPTAVPTPRPTHKPVAKANTPEPHYAPPPAETRATMEGQIETAETLLAQAEEYAQDPPHGPTGAPEWYAADMQFQTEGDKIAKRIVLRLARTQDGGRTDWDGVAFDISSNLIQSEAFLYGAVQAAVAMCNGSDARSNLRVARADIKEARRDFNQMRRDPEDWSPPEIDPPGDDDCERD